jgi:hypothetical protein
MEDFQNRVVVEKYELDVKIDLLAKFLNGERSKTLLQPERSRMDRQIMAMRGYSAILGERIEAFSA